jgi:SsrA-binding protein
MAAQKKEKKSAMLTTDALIAENRRARFDYELEERFEAGIMLLGSEVKSLRLGQCTVTESHVAPQKGEIWIWNLHIPEYKQAGPHLQHPPRRPRKLLLKAKEVKKLIGAVAKEGYTIVPTKLYFNKRGKAKLEIALAKGKKIHDKRADSKERDWNRDKRRIMRDKN